MINMHISLVRVEKNLGYLKQKAVLLDYF